LTLFNARLGYWIEKPRPIGWRAASPRFGNLLLTEFFGRTDELGEYVHISDGGHFENLGLYELIRRRCRYIVAVDAGADGGDPSDDNLANLIRLCRVDFGVRIKINTQPLEMAGPQKLTRSHVAIGTIHYDDVDQGEVPGVLIYVKISLTGDEPPDVQKYARTDPRFPHQPTDLRQSFDEEQFECYRCLGDHIAREIFQTPTEQVRRVFREAGADAEVASHMEYVPRFFAAVQERWVEAPEGLSQLYIESNRAWGEIQRDLASRAELQGLSRDLYPELAATAGSWNAPERAELHTVARMLTIMENAWIGLSLKRTSSLPINRGWMNAFRRWVASEAFRRAWPILRAKFSADFVRFCEEQLHLTAATPSAARLSSSDKISGASEFEHQAIELLDREFAREWPEEHRLKRGPRELIAKARELKKTPPITKGQAPKKPAPKPGESKPERPLVWLIIQAPSGRKKADESPHKSVSGVILAALSDAAIEFGRGRGQPSPIEFFVWVRRAHRGAGLGSRGVQEALPTIRAELQAANGETPPLVAFYPEASPADDDIEYTSLLRFLSGFDFRPVDQPNGRETTRSTFLLPQKTFGR
jgi:hypothetical protein